MNTYIFLKYFLQNKNWNLIRNIHIYSISLMMKYAIKRYKNIPLYIDLIYIILTYETHSGLSHDFVIVELLFIVQIFIIHSLYIVNFRLKLDMFSFEYQYFLWSWRDITFIVFLFFFTLPDKTKNRNNIYLFISLILSYFINLIYKNVLNYENKEKENKSHIKVLD